MKRMIVTFLSLFALGFTASAQNRLCSLKLETLGGLFSLEAKISKLSNRDHTKDKLAGAIMQLSQFSGQRQLNIQMKFKDYFQEFRNDCRAVEVQCQKQVLAFLIRQQKAGQNSGGLAESEALGHGYAVSVGQLVVAEDQAAIRDLLDTARTCLDSAESALIKK